MKLKISEERCTGCQLCQLACSATKNLCYGIHRSRIKILTIEECIQKITVCRGCRRCQCVEACHYDAFTRNKHTGGVHIEEKNCQACLACLDACPFKAVKMDRTNNIPMVCDLCDGNPQCVQNCFSGALSLNSGN